MDIHLRESQPSDFEFLEKILYEAVFWRDTVNKPSFKDSLKLPEIQTSLADWGERKGDLAVIAEDQLTPVGAAWIRYWTDENYIRGYLNKSTPALVIGVLDGYRHQGIGTRLLKWLTNEAARRSIPQISLMVSKDNFAMRLYKQTGFEEIADEGDSILMVHKIR